MRAAKCIYIERMTRFMEMDLKYCRRTELIELIETQRRTIEELKAENKALKNAANMPAPEMLRTQELTAAAEPITELPMAEKGAEGKDSEEGDGALCVILKRLDALKSDEAIRIAELERDNAALRAQLSKSMPCGGETGNLAEAALRMNGVFESAQRAAEQYIQDVKRARGDAEGILREAAAQAERIVQAAQTAAQAREKASEESIRVREEDFKRRCEELMQNYEALKALFDKMR